VTRTAVVVAHPDDELLWFAPVIPEAETVVFCLSDTPWQPELTAARERIRVVHPAAPVRLPIAEAGVYRHSDWSDRRPRPYGVNLSTTTIGRQVRYRMNYRRLLSALDPIVKTHDSIYTHNPWGEYGHEEHVQVSRAVVTLAVRHNRSVWMWDGFPPEIDVAERRAAGYSDDLLTVDNHLRAIYEPLPPGLDRRRLAVDTGAYEKLRSLYVDEGAWTWGESYDPPADREYMRTVADGVWLLSPAPAAPIERRTHIVR
jgi:LmbE family N-acetylglucosaminyl deacetylase